jgi:hypothetical protein
MALEEAWKDEVTFIPDAYRTSHNITGLFALAKRLQTLIIMEPGTIPNLVEAGVGIGTYLQEPADDITVSNLKDRIARQVEKYLPNREISSVDVQQGVNKEDGKNFMAIFFKLGIAVENKDSFALTFGLNSNGNGIKSDFYF